MSDRHTMAGGNAARSQAPLALATPLREVWTAKTRTRAILAADGLVLVSDDQWQVSALDADSGRRVWRYAFASHPAVIHDQHLIAYASRDDVHLIDLRSGRPQGCIGHPWFPVAIVSEGTLVTQSRGTGRPAALTAVDIGTGQRRWRSFGPPHRFDNAVEAPAPLAAAAGTIMYGAGDGAVVALDAASGAERWRRSWPEWGRRNGEEIDPPEVQRIFILGDAAIADMGGHVVCLGLEDGRSRWEIEGAADVLCGDRIFAAASGLYHVRSAADGSGRRKPAGAGAPKALGPALLSRVSVGLVSDTHAFLIGEAALVAVDVKTGQYAWHHQPAGWSQPTAPIAVSGRLYYRNGDRLYCLAPAS